MRVKYYLILAIFLIFTHSSLMAAPKIKAIVFDLGGVIAVTDRQEMILFIAKSLGISPKEASKALIGLKETSLKGDTDNDYWVNEEYWIQYTRAKKIKLPHHWIEKLNEHRLKSVREMPGMLDLVKNLKKQGYQVALLSNVRRSQAIIKRKLGYYDLFNPTILSYEIKMRKPRLSAYCYLLQQLNLPASEVIFIDDKLENVAAAKSVGINAILFKNPRQLVNSLKERGVEIKPK